MVSLRIRYAIAMCLVGGLGIGGMARAQNLGAQAVTGGGGESTGGGIRHFSAVGLGMAVGKTEGGGITVYNGFLARAVAARDRDPPVFDPPPQNISVAIMAGAQRCLTTVQIPAIRVRDNRDANPQVTVQLRTDPPQNLDPAGDEVELGVGSYDVVVTAADRRGNQAQATFRIDVRDQTRPVIAPVPNPTPVGQEREAASPIGTPVALGAYACRDVCDPQPVLASDERARYPLGDTNVRITCSDASGNQAQADVVVRVRDRTAPTLAGDAPADVFRECNNPAGSTVAVPALVWQDNAYNANQLILSLVVDPDGANRQFNPIPDQIQLTGGRHVMRFIARDPAGNQRTQEMIVTVADRQAPRIEVVDAPQLGWYRQAANVRLRITDGCSQLAGGIEVNVQPPPQATRQVDANTLELTYAGDGLYNLQVSVEDSAGNQASDNSIGFGIDSSPPVPAVVVPAQVGVNPAQQLTFPVYAQAELMPLNVGGNEPGDGIQSGIRRVQVILDPDAQGNGRTLVDTTLPGQGNPQRGNRVAGNLRCSDNRAADAYCNRDGDLDLRKVRVGFHTLRLILTDFAGNTATQDSKFTNANLEFGADIVAGRVVARIQQGDLAAGVAQQLQRGVNKLTPGRDMASMKIQGSPYDTPLFLGGALKAVQQATINFDTAITDADAAQKPELRDLLGLLHRIAWSDSMLFREFIEDSNVLARIPVDDQGWAPDDYQADMDTGGRALDLMLAAVEAQRWTDSAQYGLDAFFSHKIAYTLWNMNVRAQPFPGFNFTEEYRRGRNILTGIRDELNLYLRLESRHGADNVEDIRDRLTQVIEGLDRIVRVGFDVEGGTTDEEYVNLLFEVRNIGNASVLANGQGVWMRNYQFAIMQVVRWMTHASTVNAQFFIGPDVFNWQLFEEAIGRIDEGVELLLPPRRVEEAVQFYGAPETTCLIVGVYHCYYLTDEARDDDDEPYPLPADSVCWDDLLQPGEWAMNPASAENRVPPACRYGDDL